MRRKGKNNPKGHNETRGKINTCKTIHERDEKYPNAKTSIEYGHFEGDTIVGKARKSLDYKTPNEVIKEATGFESLLTFA